MVKEKEKLIWLGVKRASQTSSTAASDVERLRENVEYSTYQSDLDNVASLSEHQTYLENNGFTTFQAESYNNKITANFADFPTYKDAVQNQLSSYTELKAEFDSSTTFGSELETEDGEQAAGVKVHESSGYTRENVKVPAGSVEVFGQEIHFSQTGATKTGSGSGSTSDDGSLFTVNNIRTDKTNNETTPGTPVTISADVTNNGDYTEYFVATLTEDGDAVDNDQFHISPNQTVTVDFTRVTDNNVCHDYQINTSGTVTVCWLHSGLVQ